MKLLIVGAGGHGRCCLDIARSMNIYDEINFLDDNNVGTIINDSIIIGTMDEMSSYYIEYENIFIAIGNNEVRKQLLLKAERIGYNLVNLISPNSAISPYAHIKKGCVVFPHVVIEANTSIGNGCIITANTTINHDAVIEDYCLIYSNTVIRPNALIKSLSRIGSECSVSFGAVVKAGSDIVDGTVVLKDKDYALGEGVK